jgi:hypothetical protein
MVKKHDPVNYPSHYNKGGIGCIDAIASLAKVMVLNIIVQGSVRSNIFGGTNTKANLSRT